MLGHATGIVIGWASLAAFGLARSPSVTVIGFTPARIGAVALAGGITTLVLHVIVARRPPAGASALSVSTGILSTASPLAVMFAAVVVTTAVAQCANRLTGIAVPLWSPRTPLQHHED